MKYRLLGDNDIFNIRKTILNNRGVTDITGFLNPDISHTYSPHLLEKMQEAVKCVDYHIKKGSRIHIIGDSDFDGATSFAIIYRYLSHFIDKNLITFHTHPKKEHGIILDEFDGKYDFNLLISPDGGTNDYQAHEELTKHGIDILILDHHQAEKRSEFAITVNPQLDNYPNKNLSGSMVTFKFCQAFDEYKKTNHAEQYLDLAVVGMIGDMMDTRDLENRYYIVTGLSQICNNFLKEVIEAQSYSINGKLTPNAISFYVAPLANATFRVGEMSDKINLLLAMVDDEVLVTYYNSRTKEETLVPLYKDMVRQCKNIKAKQDRQKTKIVDDILNPETTIIHYDGVIMIIESRDENMKGLVANDIASRVRKPVFILKKKEVPETYKGNNPIAQFSGSGRGYERHIVGDLRGLAIESQCFDVAEGHDNAFGIVIDENKLSEFIAFVEDKYKDTKIDMEYNVDFIFKGNDITTKLAKEFEEMKQYYGQCVKEPIIAVERIECNSPFLNEKVFSFEYKGVKYVKFKPRIEEFETFKDDGAVLTVVGRLGINEYQGKIAPQVVISDYIIHEKVDKNKFVF